MYSPKIREDLIPQLYRLAKRLDMPMTRLVHALLAHGIERLEQEGENVCEPPASGSPRKQCVKRRAPYGNPSARVQTLEGLLGDCVFALEALLMSPDLNLDNLEQATLDAVEVARETLQAVKTALTKSA